MIAIVPLLKLCVYSISFGLGIASGFVGYFLNSLGLLVASAIFLAISVMIVVGELK